MAVRAHRQQLMSAFGAHYLVAVMSSASSASLVKQPTSFNFKMLNFLKKIGRTTRTKESQLRLY